MPVLYESFGANEIRDVVLKRSGVIAYSCSAHPESRGFIVVTDTPFYAMTDRAGRFLIRDIPEGAHPIRVWHEKFAEIRDPIKVTAGKELEYQHEFKAGP